MNQTATRLFVLVIFCLSSKRFVVSHENADSERPPYCGVSPTDCEKCCNCDTSNNCAGDCKNGYHGKMCKNKCPNNCITCVDNSFSKSSHSNCTKCKKGYYLTEELYQCQLPCPSRCQSCVSNTSCTVCKNGYYGESCNSTCPENCLNGVCNKTTAACSICKKDYFGKTCNKSCPQVCANGRCDKSTGACLYKNFLSFRPSHCGVSPMNCQKCCYCDESDKCTGDCKDGYHGGRCMNECPDNCVRCEDHSDPKHFPGYANCTECKEGWYVTKVSYQCQLLCPSACPSCQFDGYRVNCGSETSNDPWLPLAISGIFAWSLLIIIGVGVGVRLWYRRRCRNDDTNVDCSPLEGHSKDTESATDRSYESLSASRGSSHSYKTVCVTSTASTRDSENGYTTIC